jgi:hypothetical protein
MNARGIREWQLPGGSGGAREFPPPADRAVLSVTDFARFFAGRGLIISG